MTEPDATAHRRGTIGAVLVCLAALVSGSLAWVLALEADGTPSHEYEPGTRFAAASLLVATVVLTAILALVGYRLAWTSRRRGRLGFSVMVGLTPCLVAVAIVPWLWN